MTDRVTMMKAIDQDRYGPPEVLQLQEIEKPAATGDQVLVRARAASVHPDVWHVVTGQPYVLRLMGSGASSDTTIGGVGRRWLGSPPRFLKLMALSPFVKQLPDLRFDRTDPLREVPAAVRHLMAGEARGRVIVTVS